MSETPTRDLPDDAARLVAWLLYDGQNHRAWKIAEEAEVDKDSAEEMLDRLAKDPASPVVHRPDLGMHDVYGTTEAEG